MTPDTSGDVTPEQPDFLHGVQPEPSVTLIRESKTPEQPQTAPVASTRGIQVLLAREGLGATTFDNANTWSVTDRGNLLVRDQNAAIAEYARNEWIAVLNLGRL